MSRDDYVAIYKTIIKKKGKLTVVYFVKWIQGDPDCFDEIDFIKEIYSETYTYSFEKALKIAHRININVNNSEYGVVLVNKYETLVIPLSDDQVKSDEYKAYFESQKEIYEQYFTEHKFIVILQKDLIYTILGNIYVKFNLNGIMQNI